MATGYRLLRPAATPAASWYSVLWAGSVLTASTGLQLRPSRIKSRAGSDLPARAGGNCPLPASTAQAYACQQRDHSKVMVLRGMVWCHPTPRARPPPRAGEGWSGASTHRTVPTATALSCPVPECVLGSTALHRPRRLPVPAAFRWPDPGLAGLARTAHGQCAAIVADCR